MIDVTPLLELGNIIISRGRLGITADLTTPPPSMNDDIIRQWPKQRILRTFHMNEDSNDNAIGPWIEHYDGKPGTVDLGTGLIIYVHPTS